VIVGWERHHSRRRHNQVGGQTCWTVQYGMAYTMLDAQLSAYTAVCVECHGDAEGVWTYRVLFATDGRELTEVCNDLPYCDCGDYGAPQTSVVYLPDYVVVGS